MFAEHGEVFISVDGDIVFVKVVGAFNTEGIVESIGKIELSVNSFCKKKFKLCIDYSEAEGASPDVYEKINECNIWLNNQNMVAKALVVKSSARLSILESRTPARRPQNSKEFDEKASAIAWLKSQS